MEPNGLLLGVIQPQVTIPVLQQRDRWVEAELEGWMWIRSLQVTSRGGYELVISNPDGENLRQEPSGRVLARLGGGTLLEELERRPGWIRVRRRGWIWAPSVSLSEEGGRAPQEGAAPTMPEPDPTETTENAVLATGPRGVAVLASPDGDTIARSVPHADLQLLGREGGWARVRLEGWVWSPAGDADGGSPGQGIPAEGVQPKDVVDAPDGYRGRVVTWDLQFISLERAEKIRTDFFEGEPFLLTRSPEGEGPFVYVAVPPEHLSEVDALLPLERITVVGRIRVGASTLTGSPILDLLELRRGRGVRRRGG